jgi:putative transcriptional regulator
MSMEKTLHSINPARTAAGRAASEGQFSQKLLIASPLQDGSFTRSVVYVCAHSEAGAMGIVINQRIPDVMFGDLLEQLNLPQPERIVAEPVVHYGGPVETGRGFVLHTTDFMRGDSVRINDSLCVTGTVDILKAIAEGRGPTRSLFALGYAGWGPGQLESEIMTSSWLVASADDELIFAPDLSRKWERALGRMGINPAALSLQTGRA